MKSLINRILTKIFCGHRWTDPKEVVDYNYRGGFEHKSIVMRCEICKRYRTFTSY